MSTILTGILLAIGFMLAPILLRAAFYLIYYIGIFFVMGLAIWFIFDHPAILIIPVFGIAAIGVITLARGLQWLSRRRARAFHIQQMRQHFADEMEIRLRNEGYYLPPPKRRES